MKEKVAVTEAETGKPAWDAVTVDLASRNFPEVAGTADAPIGGAAEDTKFDLEEELDEDDSGIDPESTVQRDIVLDTENTRSLTEDD